jgi:hypothetical protein
MSNDRFSHRIGLLKPMDIRDAQDSEKYGADGQAGGYDARRSGFDLSRAPASEKVGTLLSGKWLGGAVSED